jgi:type VI secretion system protein ImpH
MASVKDRLLREFVEFNFFQAVRVLERASPSRKPVGRDAQPADEVARFRSHLSLAFPPAQIVTLDPPVEDRRCPLLTVTFFGLYGPSGALPTHYTQMMMDLVRDMPRTSPERRALRDWLDLFNHRLISLFYRAWEKYRFYIPFERGEARAAEPDSFTKAGLSLLGLGSPGLRNRLVVRPADADPRQKPLARVDDLGLLYYAGFFAQRPRNAVNLRAILADYFGLPVEVRQFRGRWLGLPEENQTCLGEHGTMGVDAVAGDRVWEMQSRFRVRLGPLSYRQFEDLLPDPAPVAERKMFFLVAQMTRLYAGQELEFDVQLVLAADAVPEATLDEEGIGPRLGWNLWLLNAAMDRPADDPVFEGDWVTTL